MNRVQIANVTFDNVTMEEAVTRIVQMAQKTDTPRHVCTGNLDHLVTLGRDADFRKVYQDSALTLADGAPVVWLSRLGPPSRGAPLRERVTGSDLFWQLGRASASAGVRLFFLGGAPGAADLAAEAVCDKHPGAQICGTYCPPKESFGDEAEQARIREAVRAAQPDILLVGFGAPKQEKWIAANKNRLGVPVAIGVGGSFEMAGGVVRRAPQWMQSVGLEWSYRLVQEPKRLAHRYLVRDLPFLVSLMAQTVSLHLRERRASRPRPDAAKRRSEAS